MGITERKSKEKVELKALILRAAHELFVEKGIDQTSIRNIAERIEYSPATIYLYFKDKDEILHELHSQAFNELAARSSVLMAVADPLERLKAIGRVYLEFAFEDTERYDLMFMAKAPMNFLEKVKEKNWHDGERAFGFLANTVKECMAAGHFTAHDPDALSFLIWSCVHGMVALEIRDRCKGINCMGFDGEQPPVHFSGFAELVKILDKI